ncbi:unnamed protein product [Dibothriocephalus latus]|uniref:Uncharacterized protein n=1 Tax=Dibothriocephalus latus TaxID=60516 RepID=A0A3P7MHX3_DIBLA|nr:unnamed protein product [Dibothriocephalus latus]
MSYEPLLQHLDAFASTLGADSDDRRVLVIIRAGLVDSLSRYCSLGSHGLNRYVGAPVSLITYRPLSGTPAVTSTTGESGETGQVEVDRSSTTKVACRSLTAPGTFLKITCLGPSPLDYLCVSPHLQPIHDCLQVKIFPFP